MKIKKSQLESLIETAVLEVLAEKKPSELTEGKKEKPVPKKPAKPAPKKTPKKK